MERYATATPGEVERLLGSTRPPLDLVRHAPNIDDMLLGVLLRNAEVWPSLSLNLHLSGSHRDRLASRCLNHLERFPDSRFDEEDPRDIRLLNGSAVALANLTKAGHPFRPKVARQIVDILGKRDSLAAGYLGMALSEVSDLKPELSKHVRGALWRTVSGERNGSFVAELALSRLAMDDELTEWMLIYIAMDHGSDVAERLRQGVGRSATRDPNPAVFRLDSAVLAVVIAPATRHDIGIEWLVGVPVTLAFLEEWLALQVEALAHPVESIRISLGQPALYLQGGADVTEAFLTADCVDEGEVVSPDDVPPNCVYRTVILEHPIAVDGGSWSLPLDSGVEPDAAPYVMDGFETRSLWELLLCDTPAERFSENFRRIAKVQPEVAGAALELGVEAFGRTRSLTSIASLLEPADLVELLDAPSQSVRVQAVTFLGRLNSAKSV
jgi:hypothetical protein